MSLTKSAYQVLKKENEKQNNLCFDVKLERFAQFFFAKTSLIILRFLYLWVAYLSGDTRNEELAKLVYLQREQASKILIIN